MKHPKIIVITAAILALLIQPNNTNTQRPLLGNILESYELPQRMARSVQMALKELPPSETLPIILEMGCEAATPIISQLQQIPLRVVQMPHMPFGIVRNIPKPSAVLLLLGKPSWHLDFLLFHLRNSPLWDVEAAIIVVHGEEFENRDGMATQDAISAADLLLALGVAWSNTKNYFVEYITTGKRIASPKFHETQSFSLRSWSQVDYSRFRARYAITMWLPDSVTNCCDIKACTVFGPDALLVETLRRYAGPKSMCVSDDLGPGRRLSNGTFSENLGLLARRRADVLATGLLTEPEWADRVAFLYPHAQDNFCLLVRRARHVSFQRSMSRAFGVRVWKAGMGVLLVATMVRAALGVSPLDAAFGTLRSAITGGLDQRGAGPRRQIIGVLLSVGCAVVLGNAFAGSLTSFLTAPRREPEINSLSEVLEKAQRVHVVPTYAAKFDNLKRNDEVRELSRRFELTDWAWQWNIAMNEILADEPVALLMTRSGLRFLSSLSNFTDEGHARVHVARECVLSPAYVALPVRAEWPLWPRLSTVVQRAVQSGLHTQFMERSMPHYSRSYKMLRLLPGDAPRQPQALAAWQLRGPFAVLVVGLCAAAGALALELLVAAVLRLARYQLVLEQQPPLRNTPGTLSLRGAYNKT